MSNQGFSLRDAHEICVEPYLAREEERSRVRQAGDLGEARRCAGVAWSGLGPTPTPGRTAEAVRAAAEAALARAAGFAASPRGRFLRALRTLEQHGFSVAAETARAAFARGFADADRPACPAEIGAALSALGRLSRAEARHACLALTELLMGEMRLAAE